MLIAISAVDKHSAESFMKVLLTFAMSRDFDYDASYKRNFSLWFSESEAFIKRFKLPVRLLKSAQSYLLQGIDCNEDDKFHNTILDMFSAIVEKKEDMKKELDLRKEDLQFINDCRLYYHKHSESAYKRLHKNVSRFQEHDISSMFVSEHDEVSEEKDALKHLVQKYAGKEGLYTIPQDVLKEWQKHAKETGNRLPDHDRYRELRAPITKTYKTRLQSLVRSSGQPLMSTKDARAALDAEGIVHFIPAGFDGKIDDAGNLYTIKGLRMNQTPAGLVKMNDAKNFPGKGKYYNPETDDTYVCTFQQEGSPKPSRAYTMNYSGSSRSNKFTVVTETIPLIPQFRQAWRKDMRDLSKRDGVYATIVDFVDETNSRVSNKNARSKGNVTYGATTMRLKHVRITETQLIVSYQGKSSGDQYHVIDYAGSQSKTRLVRNFKELMKGKGPEDHVFTFNGKPVTSESVNTYMKRLGFPAKFTIHKFRTRTGILMAKKLLANCPFKKNSGNWTEKQVNAWFKEQMLQIGHALGHNDGGKVTETTAIKNYIDPDILLAFFDSLGLRPDSKTQSAIDSVFKTKGD